MIDFFVSYAEPDREWAIWIAWQLQNEGYKVILQDWDFFPGSNFIVNIQEAITRAARILAVLSTSYIDRRFPKAEWSSALAIDPTGEERKLVPVRIEAFRPVGFFNSLVYVDLVNLQEREAREVLLKGIKETITGRPTLQNSPNFPGTLQEIPRPQAFPGTSSKTATIDSKKSKQFIHSKITTNGMLDTSAAPNPYQELFDSTDILGNGHQDIHYFIWLPRTEVLRSSQLAPLIPVAAICTVDPEIIIDRFGQLLASEQVQALDQPPRRLRNEEKYILCRATGSALTNCFVLVVIFPDLALGLERSRPEIAYQSMLNFFLLPLLGMHKRLGFNNSHAHFFSVGEKDSLILQLAKRCAKGCYPKKGSFSLDLSTNDPTNEMICKMARLFAWAVGHYYNSGDKTWLNEIENSFNT
jgi:hypothetical protein